MASAPEQDRLELQRVVQVLLQDRILIDKKSEVWEILVIPYADVKEAEDQYRCGLITIRSLFTKMISTWKSQTNRSSMDLCTILNDYGFKLSAGKL
jgi:hypothetical protein